MPDTPRRPLQVQPARASVLLDVALLAAFLLPGFGPYLIGDEGALGRDFGSVFLDAMHQQNLALRDGHILLWDPSQLSGTAHWARPNTAPAYPPLCGLMLAFGSLEGLNVTIYLQALFGALGTCLLVRRLAGSRVGGLFAGTLFAYAYLTRFLAEVLPLEFMALTWIPWTMLCMVLAISEQRWLRYAVLGGACYAAIPWIGGYILFLPGLLTVGTLVLVSHLRAPFVPSLVRAAGIVTTFFVTFLGLSAARILPMREWIPITNRAGGLDREFALDGTLDLAMMLDWFRREGFVPLAFLAICIALRIRRRFDWSIPILACLALILAISNGSLYELLYDYVPGFDQVREPRRSWVLMPALLSTLAGLGLAAVLCRVRARAGRAAFTAAAAVAGGLFVADNRFLAEYEWSPQYSLEERVDANAIHREISRRTREETAFRVIDFEKSRSRPKRTADLMRSFCGIESVEGILGNIEIDAYGDDYLMWAREDRARQWGLMNCRYVTSAVERDEPGLVLVERFEPDADPIHRGMDGPFLYRNERELPRAFTTDRLLLLVGGTKLVWKMLLLKAEWDPRDLAVAWASEEEVASWPDAVLDSLSGALLFEVGPETKARVEAHTRSQEFSSQARAGLSRFLLGEYGAASTPPRPVELRHDWNQAHATIPDDAAARWLVMCETYSLYPGWTATVDGVAAPLLRANAVGTAVPLPPGARDVALEYRPAGFRVGVAISSAAAALVLLLLLILRRGRSGSEAASALPAAAP